MSNPFRIAVAGLGTVGAGLIDLLHTNADLLAARAGRPIQVTAVSARDKTKDRGVDLSGVQWAESAEDLAGLENVDAVVELVGGSEGTAYDLVRKSLAAGKHVVTANKALLAHHGYALAVLAEEKGVSLCYEAAVAGGIPVIKAMRDGLAGNEIKAVRGILNGTCNYILTQMRETGRDFKDVLADAQEKGYAEADPSFDIDGVDAGHKICLLASIAYGVKPTFGPIRMSGIRHLQTVDITFAEELGCKIKLLGLAEKHGDKISISVEPCLVPRRSALGAIEDVYNAVTVTGNFVHTPLFTGRGAGAGPTASAVAGDIVDLVRGISVPAFGIPAKDLRDPVFMDPDTATGRYYLRLTVLDKPGVLADVSAILRDQNISIESLVQRGRDPDQPVPLMITTHEGTKHGHILKACALIGNLASSVEEPCVMRIKNL